MWRRTKKLWQAGLAEKNKVRSLCVIISIAALMMTGCSDGLPEVSEPWEIVVHHEADSSEEVWEPPVVVESKDSGAEDEVRVKSVEEDSMESTGEISVWESTAPVIYVDGVWPDYDSDYAFTNRIVVQPFADGTFRYLSNSIEQKELEIPWVEKGSAALKEEGTRNNEKDI